MCQSKNQGGIRCRGKSGEILAQAVDTYRTTGTEDDYQQILEAQANFAASPGGMKQVQAALDRAEARGDAVMVMTLQRSVDQAEMIRQRAMDMRRAQGLAAFDPKEFAKDPGGDFGAILDGSTRGAAPEPIVDTFGDALDAPKGARFKTLRAKWRAEQQTNRASIKRDKALREMAIPDEKALVTKRLGLAESHLTRLETMFADMPGRQEVVRKCVMDLTDPHVTDEVVADRARCLAANVLDTQPSFARKVAINYAKQIVKDTTARDVEFEVVKGRYGYGVEAATVGGVRATVPA